ncbi:MAG: PEP-CTERM sorting domain-containing protein [Sedimentisphaerales bacterium]
MKKKIVSMMLVAGLMAGMVVESAMAATRYTLTGLDVGADSDAYGISDSGYITGRVYQKDYPGFDHMFRWDGSAGFGGLQFIPELSLDNVFGSCGYAVNNNGMVVGACNVGGVEHPQAVASEDAHQMYALWGLPGVNISYAFGVNNWGTAAGMLNAHAIATGYELETTLVSYAYDITDGGKVVGKALNTAGTSWKGLLWTLGDGIMRKILMPADGYTNSDARGINEIENRAVGNSFVDWDNQQATVWTKSGLDWLGVTTGTTLPYLDADSNTYSFAYEVNNDNLIVGTSGGDISNIYTHTACLWEEAGLGSYDVYNLNSLVDNMPSGWTLNDARDINAGGQIVGIMSYGYGDTYRAFVLNPVPEPATICLFALGVLSMGRKKRR